VLLEFDPLGFGIGDEIRREVTVVEPRLTATQYVIEKTPVAKSGRVKQYYRVRA